MITSKCCVIFSVRLSLEERCLSVIAINTDRHKYCRTECWSCSEMKVTCLL